jgi:hypothetical protein
VLTTDQKGAIAETAIVHEATKLGIGVFRPVAEGGRFDLVFDVGRLLRVQCKWAPRHGDVIVVRCYSCRRTRDGLVRRSYSADDVDAFAIYCPDTERCYFLTIEQIPGNSGVFLRLAPTRNNQQAGVTWAEDFEFDATLSRFGAVAQLGERLAGSQ